jgi:pimeloyl-ACP methyl ester carboxylesterase
MAEEYLKLLPNSKVLWMRDDIGHWPMVEDKIGFLDLYLDWMRVK